MAELETAADLGAVIASALERRGVPYALGGALAFGVHAIPRGTMDVDVNVFVEPSELAPVVEALREVGANVDLEAARRSAASEGTFIVHVHGFRVDVFVPSIPFSWEAARTAISVPMGDRQTRVLSAEAIAVFKLLFFRGKDLVDLERLIAVQGRRLDAAYVRRWMVEMMGEDDPRVSSWDRLTAEHMPPA